MTSHCSLLTAHSVLPSFARIASLLLIVVASWHFLPVFAHSLAYFTDTEASSGTMASGLLDLLVTDPAITEVGCNDMAEMELPVDLHLAGLAANMSASTTGVVGDAAFCEALELVVQYTDGAGVPATYSGEVAGFAAPNMSTGTLRFIASLPAGLVLSDSALCTMDIRFDAWLSPFTILESGFSDSELTQVTFAVEPGSCTEEDCPPPPCSGCAGDTTIITTTMNDATVVNDVTVSASTGGNSANGGNGGAGGVGGDGGDGGAGGTNTTGDASASASVTNVVNSNSTIVDIGGGCSCGTTCPCGSATTVTTNTSNSSTVSTTIVSSTNTTNTASPNAGSGLPTTPSAQDILANIQNLLNQGQGGRRR